MGFHARDQEFEKKVRERLSLIKGRTQEFIEATGAVDPLPPQREPATPRSLQRSILRGRRIAGGPQVLTEEEQKGVDILTRGPEPPLAGRTVLTPRDVPRGTQEAFARDIQKELIKPEKVPDLKTFEAFLTGEVVGKRLTIEEAFNKLSGFKKRSAAAQATGPTFTKIEGAAFLKFMDTGREGLTSQEREIVDKKLTDPDFALATKLVLDDITSLAMTGPQKTEKITELFRQIKEQKQATIDEPPITKTYDEEKVLGGRRFGKSGGQWFDIGPE